MFLFILSPDSLTPLANSDLNTSHVLIYPVKTKKRLLSSSYLNTSHVLIYPDSFK